MYRQMPYAMLLLCVHSAWCNEMQARITTDELAKDVAGAEALVNRHKENKAEIDARTKELNRFIQKGNSLIAEKNFLRAEVSVSTTEAVFLTSHYHHLLFKLSI